MTNGRTDHLDLTRVLECLPDVVLAIDAEATIVYASGAARSRGWDPGVWLGKNVLDILHPDDLALAIGAMATIQGKSMGTPIEIRANHPTEGWRLFEVIGTDQMADPALGVIVLSCRDLTERRRWEVAHGDTARFRAIVQNAAVITMLVNPDGRISSVSGAISRQLGYDPEQITGRHLSSLAAPGHEQALSAGLRRSTGRGVVTVEVLIEPAVRGAPRPFRFEIVDLCSDPIVAGYVVTGHDVSELQVMREALERLARHDALTGLPNRLAFADTVAGALARRDDRNQVAVFFVDLDRFKPVNDLLGHDAGDELLIAVASRLSGLIRSSDSVARIGGDEFVVLATGLANRQQGEDLAHRIETALTEPFSLRAGVATITASVGLAMADSASTVSLLLADADQAMYQVKTARRDGAMVTPRGANERRELAGALVGAVARGEIVAYFQPIVRVSSGDLVGFESLVRWHHPSGAILDPSQFLDVAHQIGMSTDIDLDVAHQAIEKLDDLQSAAPHAWVSVNMTAADLADRQLVELVGGLLTDHGLPADRFVVEVTEQATLERAVVGDQASPLTTLRELADLGVRITLDDFGTGYSSLTHLRRMTVHTLKIDRTFVDGVISDATDRSLVAAVTGLAHALGLEAIAEGVETSEQVDALRELGVDAMQGYLVSPPMHADDLRAWITRQAESVERLRFTRAS